MKRLFLIFWLVIPLTVSAQVIDVGNKKEADRRGSSILDDSTKQVYGPTTTQYYFEQSIKFNNPSTFFVDTSIIDMHRYNRVSQSQFLYQDLGNIGTALNPIFPSAPNEIGVSSGFTVYDPYFENRDEIPYYDTKSPFSRFRIIWGGQGRAITEAQYNRNINPRTNVGFSYKGYFIDKQIEREGRGDRNAQGVYYKLHASYESPNKKYRALGYFNRNRHVVTELGGILTDSNDPHDPVFFDENRRVALNDAQTIELRTDIHLYHQYKLDNLVQLYHSFDRYKQQNDFTDGQSDADYFPVMIVDSAEVKDRSKIIYNENEAGIKGDVGKTFYNFYYKLRKVKFDYKYIDERELPFNTDFLEHFGGFNLRFGNDSLSYIETYGEYRLGGNYKLGGIIRNSWFHAEGKSVQSEPTYIQKAYRGSHNEWFNDFDSPITTTLEAGFHIPLGNLIIEPQANYGLYTNYIYFKQMEIEEGLQEAPVQAGGDINVLSAQFRFSLTFFRRLNLTSTTKYTTVGGGASNAMPVPEWFTLTQLSYNQELFQGNLVIQLGADLNWKSSYYAMGYDPAIMQYYVQDEFYVYDYPLVDVFLNGKINRGKFFLKLNNISQLISGEGYFATPYYPGQTTILDFGIDWAFYD